MPKELVYTRTEKEKAIDELFMQISATQFDANFNDMDLKSIIAAAFNAGISFARDKE